MRKTLFSLLLTGIFLISPFWSSAQFGRLLKKTADKTQRKIEERMAEKAADKVEEAIFDEDQKQADEQRKNRADNPESDEDTLGEMEYSRYDLMANMNRVEDVPDEYVFDLVFDIEQWTANKKPVHTRMAYSSANSVFGFIDEENQTTIVDTDKDLIVMYRTDKNGKKVAQAMSNMMGMYAARKQQTETEKGPVQVRETGVTKSILGYKTKEFVGEDDEQSFQAFVTSDLKVKWQDSFGQLMKFGSSARYEAAAKKMDGMFLESHSTHKTDPDKNYHWVVKAISKDKVSYRKNDYSFELR